MKIVNPIAKLGEDKACEYLKKLGFKILERNYRKSYGEIDIIAIDSSKKSEPALCFIEVKTRTSNQFGSPIEAITSWKLQSLIKTAEYYKLSHKNVPDSLRIDAISILLDKQNVREIELMRNISGF